MKNLIILSILTIGSGCVSTPTFAPLCPPDRPHLESISIEEIRAAEPTLIRIVARNDLKLKAHIKLLEELIQAHNEQLGVECETD